MSIRLGLVASVTVAVSAIAAAAVMAQGGADTSGGSLAAVTAELRQLRLAIQETARNQTQMHALGAYLSAQQSRLVQTTARLDAVRRELDGLSARSNQISAELANTETEAERSAESRQQLEVHARELKQELAMVGAQLQQAQLREGELAQALQSEEARWTNLIATMEQLIKK
jgi:chromosome segregation ATPase